MIAITINNKALVLPPNLKIRVELNSTLFDTEEGIPGAIVWYFNIPAEENEETLNYANYIETAGKYRIYLANLSYFGMPLFSGKLIVKSGTYKEFRIGMAINQFSEEYQDKLITDLNWPVEITGGTPHDENNVVQFATDVARGTKIRDYEFPQLYAPKWYGDENSEGLIEKNPDFNRFVNEIKNGSFKANSSSDNGNSLVPCPKLFSVLKRIYSIDNFTVNGSVFDNSELKQLIIANNYSLDGLFTSYFLRAKTSATQVLPEDVITQVYLDDVNSDDNTDEFGCYFEGGYKVKKTTNYDISIEVELDGDKLVLYAERDITLYVYQNDTIVSQETTVWKNATRLDDSDVYSNRLFTLTVTDIPLNINDVIKIKIEVDLYVFTLIYGTYSISLANRGTTNSYANSICVKNHLPKISNNNFISSIRKTFGFAFFYDYSEKKVEIDLLKDVLKSKSYIDLTPVLIKKSEDIEVQEKRNYIYSFSTNDDVLNYSQYDYLGEFSSIYALPVPENINMVAKVRNFNAIYLYSKGDDGIVKWRFYTTSEDFVKTGITNTVEVKPDIIIPNMTEYDDIHLPQIDFQAQSKAFLQDASPVDKLHLMFYRGFPNQAITVAQTMQYVLYGEAFYSGSLLWHGDQGLYERYHRDWTLFLQKSETVTMNFLLDIEDILNIMLLFKPQLEKPVDDRVRKLRVENTTYIPRKFTIELSMSGRTECEAILEKEGYDS